MWLVGWDAGFADTKWFGSADANVMVSDLGIDVENLTISLIHAKEVMGTHDFGVSGLCACS